MNETPKALRAYQEYLDMGPDRSLRKLADKTGTKLAQLGVWSSEHNWQERIGTYEAEQFAKRRAEEEEMARQKRAAEREAYEQQKKADREAIRAMLLKHISAEGVEASSMSQIQAAKLLTEQYVVADELGLIKEELQTIKDDLAKLGGDS